MFSRLKSQSRLDQADFYTTGDLCWSSSVVERLDGGLKLPERL
jgi:hypothetical protein